MIENELIRWMLDMFNAPKGAVGSTSVGGTESIFLACLAYRERAFQLGIKNPEILVNESIHVAFNKA